MCWIKNENEAKMIEELCNMIEEQQTKEILSNTLSLYLHKKNKYKRRYFLFRILYVVLNGVLLIVSTLSQRIALFAVGVTLIAALNSICLGLEALFDSKDSWLKVSTNYEKLKLETIQYVCKIGEYKAKEGSDQEKEALRIKFLEKVMGTCEERVSHFVNYMEQKKDVSNTKQDNHR